MSLRCKEVLEIVFAYLIGRQSQLFGGKYHFIFAG